MHPGVKSASGRLEINRSFVQLSLLHFGYPGIIMIEYHMLWDGILFAPDIEHIMSVNAVVHRDL